MKKIMMAAFLVVCVSALWGRTLKTGAAQPERYLPLLKGKSVALLGNHTSRIGNEQLLDFLLQKGVDVKKIFCPEHGFRGTADAGETVKDHTDPVTGLPVISLYGKNKKPTPDQLKGIDVVVVDIQDVGIRFYTYLSTLHYMMEACSENNVPLILLDRPDPNGDYVSGPVLDLNFRSFVGMEPVPVVYGCTLGEMARMINGEGWLKNGEKCRLTVVPVAGYTHHTPYSLPEKPSPNLPNDQSVRLYPSLCFFEATHASIGRGTAFPFQVIGFPDPSMGTFRFTPRSTPGMATHPVQEGKACYGIDLRREKPVPHFTLAYFIEFYSRFKNESDFLKSEKWFNLLAGNATLLQKIRAGMSAGQIEKSWQKPLKHYLKIRSAYLLYPE